MTRQTEFVNRLVGSPAGFNISRLCALTLAALLATGGAAHGFGQAPPVTPTPTPAPSAIQKPEKKAGVPPAPKIMHGYEVHQVLELGGNIVSRDGSSAMWATIGPSWRIRSSGSREEGPASEIAPSDSACSS